MYRQVRVHRRAHGQGGAGVAVVLGQDFCAADVEEDAGALGVHKPHAEVLISKWVLLVRYLHDRIGAEATTRELWGAGGVPEPRQVLRKQAGYPSASSRGRP